ncbi:hypothetical protein L6164_005907 [Bauhinia variegata]|uniref:Uncharacterized protein n=1 Tax=Bauhinia variegata TaxID=167791 RepID=A0ACB9PS02_BAUVA|nr:hypothetical protein L6164_005907 [Bauhinia variegata]
MNSQPNFLFWTVSLILIAQGTRTCKIAPLQKSIMATTTTLQRSSYSFRRQGSSGRIWTDHITFGESKTNAASAGRNVSGKENVSQIPGNKQEMVKDDHLARSQSLSSSSSSKSENKGQRSFLYSIFPCMSS